MAGRRANDQASITRHCGTDRSDSHKRRQWVSGAPARSQAEPAPQPEPEEDDEDTRRPRPSRHCSGSASSRNAEAAERERQGRSCDGGPARAGSRVRDARPRGAEIWRDPEGSVQRLQVQTRAAHKALPKGNPQAAKPARTPGIDADYESVWGVIAKRMDGVDIMARRREVRPRRRRDRGEG